MVNPCEPSPLSSSTVQPILSSWATASLAALVCVRPGALMYTLGESSPIAASLPQAISILSQCSVVNPELVSIPPARRRLFGLHWLRSQLKDVASLNITCISSIEETSQPEISLLNCLHCQNIPEAFFTLETFHALRSPVNFSFCLNICRVEVALPIFQVSTSALRPTQERKRSVKSSTPLTSQSFRCHTAGFPWLSCTHPSKSPLRSFVASVGAFTASGKSGSLSSGSCVRILAPRNPALSLLQAASPQETMRCRRPLSPAGLSLMSKRKPSSPAPVTRT